MTTPRFRVDPGDVPAVAAARRLGLSEAAFAEALPRLLSRGFPAADPDTGMFDLDAIDRWRRRRNPQLYPEETALTATAQARDARDVVGDRLKRLGRG